MKKLIFALTVFTSLSVLAAEVIRNPKVGRLDINCSSNKDAVCKYLGFEESVAFSCKRPLRTFLMNSNFDYDNGKSVEVRLTPAGGIGFYEMMITPESKGSVYARYSIEGKKTKILKSIECE